MAAQAPGTTGGAADPATSTDASSTPIIRTPDQRLRVFISSTLQELAPERAAAREAVSHLRLTPVMFELGARPHPPRDLYRAYLAQSDIFVGIYWERYGWVAPTMDISGLEDEYRLSGDRPKLIYVKTPAPEREPALKTLLDRIKADDNASYKPFATPDELHDLVENDLALLLTERFDQVRTASVPQAEAPAVEMKRAPLPVERTELVGRGAEAEQVLGWLTRQDGTLVTLTGPGGVGKTSLALHVATRLREALADGAVWVPLATVRDAAHLALALAGTLGLRETGGQSPQDSLVDALRDKQLLLVLDNFEQVSDGVPLIARLLEACPRLKLLVTSRRKLRVRGEKELSLAPLAVPGEGRIRLEQLADIPAVRLFVQRARDVKPDFAITSATARAVAQLCRRLDGLPLAIELAAARIKVLPPRALLNRLDRALPLLTGGARDLPDRQQTMRGTIAWSYDLLTEPEKTLLRRLAVFAGGWTLESAEAICNPDAALALDVLEGTESLVENSLLLEEETPAGDARFRMLATIREFALERLAESGEDMELRRRHAEHYLALVREAEPQLTSAARWEWLARLDAEHENLRAALDWASASGDATVLAGLVGGLGWFWFLRGYLSEGRSWAETAVRQTDATSRDVPRARVLHWAAGMAFAEGDYRAARQPAEESAAMFREANDARELGYALIILGLTQAGQGDPGTARATLEESVAVFNQRGGDRWGEAFARYCLGDMTRVLDDLPAARATDEESLAIFQEMDDEWGRAMLLHALGMVADAQGDAVAAQSLYVASEAIFREMGDRWDLARVLVALEAVALRTGDVARARAACAESLDLSRELGNKNGILRSLEGLAAIALVEAQPEMAARLLGAVDAQSRAAGRPAPEKLLADVRAQMEGATFEAALAAGAAMALDEAAALAVGEPAEVSVG